MATETPAVAPPDVSQMGPSKVPNQGSRWRFVALATGVVIAVAAAVLLLVLYQQATGDKSNAEDALALSQADLKSTTESLASTETAVSDLERELAQADTQLGEAEADLRGAQADLGTAEADLNEAHTDLNEAKADLREAEASGIEAKSVVIEFFAVSFSEGGGLEEAAGRCLAESLVESRGPEVLLTLLEIGTAAEQAMSIELAELGIEILRVGEQCGIRMDAFADQPGFSYGDNPVLDALQDQCTAGSGPACDALYAQSAAFSEYERFGATCGDRFTLQAAPLVCQGAI